MLPFSRFSRYWKALVDLHVQSHYAKADLLCENFHLFSQSGLDAYYVPFHHLNAKARIVIVGVTPCWTQVERAFSIAKQGLADGLDKDALFAHVDRTGRFNGPTRWNLVEMLDGIGLQDRLGISSCASLFRESGHLAHFTSAIGAPVFRGGENYTGVAPYLLSVPSLKDFVLEYLAEELRALPDAVIIPLGDVSGEALQFLHGRKLITLDRCLAGFPHPSGANVLRRARYEQGRTRWTDQLEALMQFSGRPTRARRVVAGTIIT
jgi:hypothetical protein